MASAQQSTSSRRKLIVHHLSDLQYEGTGGNRQHDMLVRYQSHLGRLPEERRPDIVVITGNLTATGRAEDLRTVAITLRACFNSWEEHFHEHVFIVPGPCDVSWEDGAPVGLQAFYENFGDFALPYHMPMPFGQDTPASGQKDFLGYPIDTCYSPYELRANLKDNFTRYATSYGRFIKRRGKLNTRWTRLWNRTWRPRRSERVRARTEQLASLRQQFLALTEGGQLVDLRAGRITQADLERFEGWAQPIIKDAGQNAGGESPLKILITYHPFAIHAERNSSVNAAQNPQTAFNQVAKMARAAGFQLALHGFVHNPQLLTDMSLFEGPDHRQPILQMGAASLGETGVFNEITAVERVENGESAWRVDLRLVSLKDNGAADLAALSLLNPAETADKRIEQLTRHATRRSGFERRMGFAMRRFAEQVHQGHEPQRQSWQNTAQLSQDRSNMAPLPPEAMHLIREVVQDEIFSGYETRVRLLLKSYEKSSAIPKLIPTYLTPAVMEGPDALIYPASVAAWSLILGRRLIYPAIESQGTDEEDHEWLRRAGKFEPVLSVLKALMQEAASASNPGKEAFERYNALHTDLEAIRGAIPGARVAGKHIYQPAPVGNQPQGYPYFICVPYPLRVIGGALSDLPETMALDVAVRRAQQPDGQQTTQDTGSIDNPFTQERIEMLEMLAESIGLMLTIASALGRPRGVWDKRYWP
jgi:calcineurin-like phosphoesterase family protein